MVATLPEPDTHEGAWLYVATPLIHVDGAAIDFVERIKRVIEAAGRFPVLSPETPGGTKLREHAHEALRFAQACIIDISTDSDAVGADLGCALANSRPVIALCDRTAVSNLLAAAITASDRGRLIRYGDPGECVAQLEMTFADPEWWRLVTSAVAQDVA